MVHCFTRHSSLPSLATIIESAVAVIGLAIVGTIPPSPASAEDLRSPARIESAAKACIEHLIAGRSNQYVACLHPNVASAAGGTEALVALYDRSRDTARGMGIELTGVTVTTPKPPVKVGDRYFSIVPDTVTSISVPADGVENTIVQPSYYLAILEPNAKTWVFMDGWLINEKLLARYLPDLSMESFKQQLTLPTSSKSS